MMKIYSAPKIDRGVAAKKMLLHCVFAFLVLSAAVRVSNKTDNFDELADILKGCMIQ